MSCFHLFWDTLLSYVLWYLTFICSEIPYFHQFWDIVLSSVLWYLTSSAVYYVLQFYISLFSILRCLSIYSVIYTHILWYFTFISCVVSYFHRFYDISLLCLTTMSFYGLLCDVLLLSVPWYLLSSILVNVSSVIYYFHQFFNTSL